MPDQPPRKHRKNHYHHGDLANALLAAVEEIISEKGVAGVTLREAARRAGVSHSAPAHHFGDKQGMLLAFVHKGFLMLGVELAKASAGGSGATYLEQTREMGKAYIRFAAEHPAHFNVMFRWGLDVHESAELHAAAHAAFEFAEERAEALISAGLFPEVDPYDLAGFFWALVHGLATLWVEGSLPHMYEGEDFDEVVDAILSAAFAYRAPE